MDQRLGSIDVHHQVDLWLAGHVPQILSPTAPVEEHRRLELAARIESLLRHERIAERPVDGMQLLGIDCLPADRAIGYRQLKKRRRTPPGDRGSDTACSLRSCRSKGGLLIRWRSTRSL